MDKTDLNKRLMLAFFLSFIVFVGLEYFIQQNQPKETKTDKTSTTQTDPTTPTNNSPATPSKVQNNPTPAKVETTKTNNAPIVATAPIISTITSKEFVIEIDHLGRIGQFTLLDEKYKTDDDERLKIFDNTKVKPLEVRFSDTTLNQEAFKTSYTASVKEAHLKEGGTIEVVLTQKLSSTTITKTIIFSSNGGYSLNVKLSNNADYFITTGYRPTADHGDFMIVKGALIRDGDKIISTIEDGEADGDEKFKSASLVSAFDRYYTSLLYNLDKGMQISILKVEDGDPLIFVQGEQNLHLGGFIGPKDYKVLNDINPQLTDAIEYGWFTFLAKPFFAITLWIYNYVGNWGWAIVLFTLLIKIVLFPLSYKGMMSMQKLKDLAPKMKEIKERYGKDPMKMNQHMMELYRKHDANPMGGCLPMLLQIPVFFALYRVLLNAVELQGAQWILWIEDLSKLDPYFILPILMGASMYLQQKLTPTTITDPLQQKIFMYLPLILTIFFVTFPAGLVLYWFTNNLLSIAQQYFINIQYEKHKTIQIAAHKKHKDK
ncbi:MAG: membrane protein insertase YidC [Campylobacterales bacterium]|nr:membrane protein insertase YidC [Campylobacterales bacterium]